MRRLRWPNSSASTMPALERRAEHGDERLLRARPRVVDHACEDALARAGLTESSTGKEVAGDAAEPSLRASRTALERPTKRPNDQSEASCLRFARPRRAAGSRRRAGGRARASTGGPPATSRAPGRRRRAARAAAREVRGGEVTLAAVLEMDERRDLARNDSDRDAQHRRDAQRLQRLRHCANSGSSVMLASMHVFAGLDHAREQAAAEAARVALELPRGEAVEHAILDAGRLRRPRRTGRARRRLRATACSRIVCRTCVGSATRRITPWSASISSVVAG